MENPFITTDKQTLQEAFKAALYEYDREKERLSKPRFFTINQAAKRMGLAHATVKKLISNGRIEATPDNRITEKAINDYLGLKK